MSFRNRTPSALPDRGFKKSYDLPWPGPGDDASNQFRDPQPPRRLTELMYLSGAYDGDADPHPWQHDQVPLEQVDPTEVQTWCSWVACVAALVIVGWLAAAIYYLPGIAAGGLLMVAVAGGIIGVTLVLTLHPQLVGRRVDGDGR